MQDCPDGITKKIKKNESSETVWKWETKKRPPVRKNCNLVAEVTVDLDHNSTPFDFFKEVIALDSFLEITVSETNRYTNQKGHSFETMSEEIMAFSGITTSWQ